MANRTKEWLIQRMDELLAEAKKIEGTIRASPPPSQPSFFSGNFIEGEMCMQYDHIACTEWREKCIAALSQFVPATGPNASVLRDFAIKVAYPPPSRFRHLFALLRAARDNFEKGFYDNLLHRIEAEITCDYMGQAESLLTEGQSGRFDHVPAAVLAGAVLEKTLRTLCAQQSPPVEITKPDGSNKMLASLIDDLKKAGLYNEARAKQLRTWAAIRNHAAHGEFDQFTRQDVELMLTGITNFLAEHLA